MTVSTTLNKITYQGNGSATVFPFSFAVPAGPNPGIQVFFTDAVGNVSLINPGQYTLIINAVSGNNPTPAGGSVTYNPGGSPIAAGTSLTIIRTLSLSQLTSLANQGTLWQPVTEAALDFEMMASQQILEIQNRALTVAVSDPAPSSLPAVAARANLFMAFDSSGNPIATQPGGANTPISAAMVPVVTAATLAAGRTAFGLGTMATENIGAGLQDNGAGAVRTFDQIVADSSNQAVTSAFHSQIRAATGALTYTLPLTSTLFNGFFMWVYALTAAVTMAVNAADKFSGGSTGASLIIPAGTQAFIGTDAGGNWFLSAAPTPGGFVKNLQLNVSLAANAMTISVKDRNGNDPSTASPVLAAFRDVNAVQGDPVLRAITTPLSITVPAGASLGTVNGIASKIWVAWFDNAGTPVLGVYDAVNGTNVLSWDEAALPTGTAISGGSTTSTTWYTASGVTAKAHRILGSVESTQPTAGQWSTAITRLQLFGPGVKRPGDVVQEGSALTALDTTSSGTFVALTNSRISFNVQNQCDPIRIEAFSNITTPNGFTASTQLSRGVVNNAGLIGSIALFSNPAASPISSTVSNVAYDLPNVVGAVTYAVQGKTSGGTLTYTTNGSAMITIKEIAA